MPDVIDMMKVLASILENHEELTTGEWKRYCEDAGRDLPALMRAVEKLERERNDMRDFLKGMSINIERFLK